MDITGFLKGVKKTMYGSLERYFTTKRSFEFNI